MTVTKSTIILPIGWKETLLRTYSSSRSFCTHLMTRSIVFSFSAFIVCTFLNFSKCLYRKCRLHASRINSNTCDTVYLRQFTFFCPNRDAESSSWKTWEAWSVHMWTSDGDIKIMISGSFSYTSPSNQIVRKYKWIKIQLEMTCKNKLLLYVQCTYEWQQS